MLRLQEENICDISGYIRSDHASQDFSDTPRYVYTIIILPSPGNIWTDIQSHSRYQRAFLQELFLLLLILRNIRQNRIERLRTIHHMRAPGP